MRFRIGVGVSLVGLTALLLVGCGSSSKPAASGTTAGTTASNSSSGSGNNSPIVIGYIGSITGVASAAQGVSVDGAMARVDAQNAAGGVNGHKIQLISEDDTSTPTGNLNAAEALVTSKHPFAVIDNTPLAYGGYKFLQQQGIPVTGGGFDGPEWGEQPNSNMFSWALPTTTKFAGQYYTYTTLGKFLKDIGVTKFGGLGFGISPSSQESVRQSLASAAQIGIPTCYTNLSVPFSGVDFTADVLQIKNAGCTGITTAFNDPSDAGLSSAIAQAGLKDQVKQIYATGYDETILGNPAARESFNGAYVSSTINFTNPTSGTQQMLQNLSKYYPGYKGGIPSFGLYSGYLSADLMIEGLEKAGSNPTRTTFINNLRRVSSYDAGGILSSPVSFQNFGTVAMLPTTSCEYFVQLQGSQFVIYKGAPICGNRVPVS